MYSKAMQDDRTWLLMQKNTISSVENASVLAWSYAYEMPDNRHSDDAPLRPVVESMNCSLPTALDKLLSDAVLNDEAEQLRRCSIGGRRRVWVRMRERDVVAYSFGRE